MPTDVLIVGCGDLGCTFGQDLVAQGYQVAGVRRTAAALPGGIASFAADVTNSATLLPLAQLRPTILVYSVAASEQTDASYQAQYVTGLKNTLETLAPSGSLRHAFFVSSTRPYGQSTSALLDEASVPQPADFGGRRLLEAEALLAGTPFPTTVLRLSGIYGPGRSRMLRLAANPDSWPQQNGWTNRIHRDDAAAFIAFLVKRALDGESPEPCYIVTDSAPVPQHEVLHWLAGEMGHPAHVAMPATSGGKRLSNARMLATGFRLRYPTYREGYAKELQTFLAREGHA